MDSCSYGLGSKKVLVPMFIKLTGDSQVMIRSEIRLLAKDVRKYEVLHHIHIYIYIYIFIYMSFSKSPH